MSVKRQLLGVVMVDRTGKVAVVTGGGSGLGAAMAREFAGAGMSVAVLDIDGPAAEQTATAPTGPSTSGGLTR